MVLERDCEGGGDWEGWMGGDGGWEWAERGGDGGWEWAERAERNRDTEESPQGQSGHESLAGRAEREIRNRARGARRGGAGTRKWDVE